MYHKFTRCSLDNKTCTRHFSMQPLETVWLYWIRLNEDDSNIEWYKFVLFTIGWFRNIRSTQKKTTSVNLPKLKTFPSTAHISILKNRQIDSISCLVFFSFDIQSPHWTWQTWYWHCIYIYIFLFVQGDSGGPLACKDLQDRWKVVGVASYVFKTCNVSSKPSVYAMAAPYLDWIRQETG